VWRSPFPSRRLLGPLSAAVAAALVWSVRWVLIGAPPTAGDTHMYLDMARGVEVEPPWSLHVLTPWIAGTLFPTHAIAGFVLVSGASFVGTSAAVERVLAALGSVPRERAFGVATFLATSTGVFMFRQFALVDSLSYCLLAWACAATLQKQDLSVSALTAAGVLNRETALFVVPVWLWANHRTGWRAVARACLVFAPAVITYVGLHHTSLAYGREPAHLNYLSPTVIALLWGRNLSWLGTNSWGYGLAICVFMAFGPSWFLAARGVSRALYDRDGPLTHGLAALWTLVLPTGFALAVGVDWRRGFQPLFLPVIAAGILALRGLSLAGWRAIAATTVLCDAATTEAWWFPRIGPVALGSLLLWMVVVAWTLWREEPTAAAPARWRERAPSDAARL
jgi:hypothetical protein